MNLGFAALYIAFAAVALWLLGEVLLQHRAPVLWRVLALVGFAAVASGVVLSSVPLICVGAVGFATGQAMVTRAVKHAQGVYWSLRAEDGSVPGILGHLPFVSTAPGASPAAADDPGMGAPPGRSGEVGPVVEVPAPQPPPPAEAAPVPSEAPRLHDAPTQSWETIAYGYATMPDAEPALHQTRPLDEDSDNYGVYTGAAAQQAAGYVYQEYGGHDYSAQEYGGQYPGHDPQYSAQYSYEQQSYQQQGYDYGGYGYQDPYQQQSVPQDPYAAVGQQQNGYEYYPQQGYDQAGYAQYEQYQDPYQQQPDPQHYSSPAPVPHQPGP